MKTAEKIYFDQLSGVRSTQKLVEIHNILWNDIFPILNVLFKTKASSSVKKSKVKVGLQQFVCNSGYVIIDL